MEELRATSKGPSDPGPLKGLQLFFTGLLGSRASAIAETVRYAPPQRRLITGQWGISGGETFVAVVQSTDLRERDDPCLVLSDRPGGYRGNLCSVKDAFEFAGNSRRTPTTPGANGAG
jgi:hypothetical protein